MTLVEQERFMPSPMKPLVSLDDIEKIDVRIGTIELVEEVPRSDRLVKLTVNFGDHKRSILVGMKKERSDPKRKDAIQRERWRENRRCLW
jgi:tRNA-binding protein